jgi:hypothetical protein
MSSLAQLTEVEIKAVFATWVYEQLSRGYSLLGVDLFDAEETDVSQFAVIATRLGYISNSSLLSASDFIALMDQRDEYIGTAEVKARRKVFLAKPEVIEAKENRSRLYELLSSLNEAVIQSNPDGVKQMIRLFESVPELAQMAVDITDQ